MTQEFIGRRLWCRNKIRRTSRAVAQPEETLSIDKAEAPLKPAPRVSGRPLEPRRSSPFLAAFWARNGLRAGWHLLIFFLILATLSEIERLILRAMGRNHLLESKLTAQGYESGGVYYCPARELDHGEDRAPERCRLWTPLAGSVSRPFLVGGGDRFAVLTGLLGAMHAIGVLNFGMIGLHGAEILKYAVLWAMVFLFGALFEEWFFRGYFQFTLTKGIGFWPAAVVTSALFGYAHHTNSGETIAGTLSAGAVGFLFCLLLRRTGDLWMPIGFHAAWNWSETYFYGVPNIGGSVGPEGSWLCVALMAASYLVIAIRLGETRYPNPSAALNTIGRLSTSSGLFNSMQS